MWFKTLLLKIIVPVVGAFSTGSVAVPEEVLLILIMFLVSSEFDALMPPPSEIFIPRALLRLIVPLLLRISFAMPFAVLFSKITF